MLKEAQQGRIKTMVMVALVGQWPCYSKSIMLASNKQDAHRNREDDAEKDKINVQLQFTKGGRFLD